MPDTDLFLQLAQKRSDSPPPKESIEPTKEQVAEAQKTALERVSSQKAISQVLKTRKQGSRGRDETKLRDGRKVQQEPSLSDSQSVDLSINHSIDRPVDSQLTGEVVERPVAFYIPKVINERIEEAIDYMQKRHRVTIDRSALVSAILGNPALWEPESLNQLVDRAVNQLTSRLTSRLKK